MGLVTAGRQQSYSLPRLPRACLSCRRDVACDGRVGCPRVLRQDRVETTILDGCDRLCVRPGAPAPRPRRALVAGLRPGQRVPRRERGLAGWRAGRAWGARGEGVKGNSFHDTSVVGGGACTPVARCRFGEGDRQSGIPLFRNISGGCPLVVCYGC